MLCVVRVCCSLCGVFIIDGVVRCVLCVVCCVLCVVSVLELLFFVFRRSSFVVCCLLVVSD